MSAPGPAGSNEHLHIGTLMLVVVPVSLTLAASRIDGILGLLAAFVFGLGLLRNAVILRQRREAGLPVTDLVRTGEYVVSVCELLVLSATLGVLTLVWGVVVVTLATISPDFGAFAFLAFGIPWCIALYVLARNVLRSRTYRGLMRLPNPDPTRDLPEFVPAGPDEIRYLPENEPAIPPTPWSE